MPASFGAIEYLFTRFGIPEGWDDVRLGGLAEIVGGATPDRAERALWSDGRIPWATPTDLTEQQSKWLHDTADHITDRGLRSCSAQLLPKGAILYTSRATIGAKSIAAVPVATNQGFANFLPNDTVDGEFLYYLLDLATPVIIRLGAGTTFLEVNKRDLRKIRCSIPQPQEQSAIARILGEVDSGIEQTRTAIDKARLLKRGLMQQAFAQITAMPTKLGRFVAEIRYETSQASNDNRWGYPTLRIPNIIGGAVNLRDLSYVDAPAGDATRFSLEDGDLLVVRTNGNPSYVGRSAVFKAPDAERWLYASYLIRVRLSRGLVPRFVDEFFKTGVGRRELFRRVTTSAGNYNINTKSLQSIRIAIPDDEESQNRIVELADGANGRISTIDRQLRGLARLKRGLMQDLLTGKVRVRIPKAAKSKTKAIAAKSGEAVA